MKQSNVVAAGLIAGGVLYAVGGQLHPRGKGDTKDAYLDSMLTDSNWAASHLAQFVALAVITATYVIAYRADVFGRATRRWVLAATVGAGIAAAEMLPHLAASSEHHSLEHGEATPILDTHLLLQVVATPALGLTTAALAIAVARASGTLPARLLAGVAVVFGVAYALAGPLVRFTEDLSFTKLFPAQAGIAIWILGTGVRVLLRNRRNSASAEPELVAGQRR